MGERSAPDRIDLAHEAAFALGTLSIRPSTREVVHAGGTVEVVEPRVMQVLVALARADGAILSRDDLTRSCWEGRVVGEDAINRVISRLRRLADGIAGGQFRIETVTKVGYRLVLNGSEAEVPAEFPVQGAPEHPARGPLPRRAIIMGAAAAYVAVAGGGYWWRHRAPASRTALPPDVLALMQQGGNALRQGDPQATSQAIGLFRRAVELQPDFANGWGALASAYAVAARSRPAQYVASLEAHSRAAAARALALDPGNPYAEIALVSLLPRTGNWARAEQVARRADARHPNNEVFLAMLSGILAAVGRVGEAAGLTERIVKLAPPSPGLGYSRVQLLWSANRLEEADSAMTEAFALFPMHFAVWFTRFYLLTYTGRAREAIALGEDRGSWPTGIPEQNFDLVLAAARAIASGAKSDIDTALDLNMAAARKAAGQAENTIQFASAVGRLDDAFALAEAYFLGRGFQVGDVRFSELQGGYTRRVDRRTFLLFMPTTAAMRSDPRFEPLVRDIGLARYWQQSGTVPDYSRAR